jgi:hypothetical protein
MRGREDVFPSVKNPEVRKNLEVTLKRNAKVVQEYNHEVDGVLDVRILGNNFHTLTTSVGWMGCWM